MRCAFSDFLDTGKMVEYRKNSHVIWGVKYHLVWITKYRFKVLRGEIAVRTRDFLRQICEGREVVV
jgi:putative transposase